MIQFYCPDIESSQVLPESDSGHAVRVLRLGEGDMIQVIDGRGGLYECQITGAHPKRTSFEIIKKEISPNHWAGTITLAVAPTKMMERMEWMVEKLVEIGVNRIVPLRCARSERKELKRERLVKVAISAMKQSLKSTLPQIDGMMPFREFMDECRKVEGTAKYLCYCDKSVERHELAALVEPGRDAVILIGPEGDFSSDEVHSALECGFIPVTLGQSRLRTETAAIVAATTLHVIAQRYSERESGV